MCIDWTWDFEEAHPRTQLIRGEKLQLNRNNYMSLGWSLQLLLFLFFPLLSFPSCHHQKQLVLTHLLAQPVPFPSPSSGFVCPPPPSLLLRMVGRWAEAMRKDLSFPGFLHSLYSCQGIFFANYLVAAHILVNNNLDNLKKKLFQATDVTCFAGRLSKITGRRTVARVDYHVPRMNLYSWHNSIWNQNQDSATCVV